MAFIPEEVIDQVLRTSNIVEVIEGYVPLKQTGKYYRALCPFHTEKTPSFTVNPERQIFYCFGCGEGGDVFRFLMRREGFSFPDAVRHLAERAGIPIPERGRPREEGALKLFELQRLACDYFQKTLKSPEGAVAREYLSQRGVGSEAVERFQLGYALAEWDGLLRELTRLGLAPRQVEAAGLVLPRQGGRGYYDRFRDRLMIPICDSTGKIVGFGGRALGEQQPKYINSPETPVYKKGVHLYGLHLASRAIRETRMALVVEGYFDAISLHSAGFPQTVASLGTALTAEQVALLHRYADKVTLIFDPDPAGIQAAWRGLELLVAEELGVGVVILPHGKDPDTFARESGKDALLTRIAAAQDVVDFLLSRAEERTGLERVDDQAAAARQVLRLIAFMPEGVRRAKYIQKLAERLGVSEGSVLAELRRLGSPDSAVTSVPPSTPLPPAEKTLIQICLLFPEVRPVVSGSIREEELSASPLRSIYGVLREFRGTEESLARSLNHHPDPVVRQVAAELFVRGMEEFTDPHRMVQDCLVRLKLREVQAELKSARERGDLVRVKALLDHKRTLTSGRISETDYIK
ncbi:MAG TPA: DNA primase [Candidatus Methylomirabilis sp.]|nr:DNA primase [Candidatus Methylomirabilis sp.]